VQRLNLFCKRLGDEEVYDCVLIFDRVTNKCWQRQKLLDRSIQAFSPSKMVSFVVPILPQLMRQNSTSTARRSTKYVVEKNMESASGAGESWNMIIKTIIHTKE
jgi:hypothetical protein